MTFQEFAKFHQNSNLLRIDNLPRTLEMILVPAQTGDNLIPGDIAPENCACIAMLFRQFEQFLTINLIDTDSPIRSSTDYGDDLLFSGAFGKNTSFEASPLFLLYQLQRLSPTRHGGA